MYRNYPYLTTSQLVAFLEALDKFCEDLHVRLGVRLMMFLGFTRTRVSHLRWSDLDSRLRCYYRPSRGKFSERVPIPKELSKLLRTHRAKAEAEAIRRRHPLPPWVFFGLKGGPRRFTCAQVRQALRAVGWTSPTDSALLRRSWCVAQAEAHGLELRRQLRAYPKPRPDAPRYSQVDCTIREPRL